MLDHQSNSVVHAEQFLTAGVVICFDVFEEFLCVFNALDHDLRRLTDSMDLLQICEVHLDNDAFHD